MTACKHNPNDPPWLKRYKKLWDKEHAPTIPVWIAGAETLVSRAEWRKMFGAGMTVTGSLAKALAPARAPADPLARSRQSPGPSLSQEDLADWVAPPPTKPEER